MEFYLTAILQGLCLSMMALGIYISMKIFNIPDITTDGTYTLGATVTAVCLSQGMSPALTLPIAMLAGAIAGAITGFIHTQLKMNALLAGILVMTALYSVNLSIMGRSNVPLLQVQNIFQIFDFGLTPLFNSFLILVLFLGGFLGLLTYMLKTDFGLAMRATGNSETMIRAMGVNTNVMKIIGLAMANALTAAAGFLMAQLQGFADINMGIGIVIAGLGAVVMGEAFVQSFKIRSVLVVLLMMSCGAIFFQLALALALTAGIDASLLKFVTALLVLVIVTIPKLSLKG